LPEELIPIVVFPEYKTKISEYEKKKHSLKTIKNGTDFMNVFEDYGIDLFRGDIQNPKVLSFITDGNFFLPDQEHVVKIANSVVKVQMKDETEPTNILVSCIKGTEDMSEMYLPRTSDIERVYKEHVCIALYGHKEDGKIVGTKQFLYFWNDMINSSGWAGRILVNQVVKKIRSVTKDSVEKIRTVGGGCPCHTVWKNGKKERKNQKRGFAQAKRFLNTEKRLKTWFYGQKNYTDSEKMFISVFFSHF